MKKWFAALVVLLCCGIAWRVVAAPSDAPPAPAAAPGGVQPAVAEVRGDAAPDATGASRALASTARVATTGALRIRVLATTATGEDLPLPGSMVDVWAGDSAFEPFDDSTLRMTADERGEVALPTLVPSTWHACLPAQDADARAIAVIAGAEALLEFRQPVRAVIHGIVVDVDGAAVAGAEVWVERGSGSGRFREPEPTEIGSRRAAVSGADGRFELVTVDPRESRVAARLGGFGESLGRYLGSRRDELRLVLLRAEARVRGTVRDEAGSPVAGALVSVMTGGTDSRRFADGTLVAGRATHCTRTGSDGAFRFDGLAPGLGHFGASASPRQPVQRDVAITAGDNDGVDLVLADGITIVGSVRRADGAPARARVESRSERQQNGHYSECDVRPDGTFLLASQPRRPLLVIVSCDGTEVAARQIEASATGIVHCDLVLDGIGELRGRVVDGRGRGLQDWGIDVEGAAGKQLHRSSGADGAFRIVVSPEQVFTVTVTAAGAKTPAIVRAGVRVGDELELRVPDAALPRAVVCGRIVASDGSPAADRDLRLVAEEGHTSRATRTAADGTFAFADLIAARWSLEWLHRGNHTELRAGLDLGDGEQQDLGDIALAPVGTLVPEFVDARGGPWNGDPVGIALWDAAGKEVDVDHDLSTGRMRALAPAGSYQLTIRGTDLIAAPQPVTVVPNAETAVRIALATGRTRRLTFNGNGSEHPESGTPLHVTVRAADGSTELQQDLTRMLTGNGGALYWYLHRTFVLGHYEIEAHTDGELRYRGALDIDDDLDAPTVVDVPRAQ